VRVPDNRRGGGEMVKFSSKCAEVEKGVFLMTARFVGEWAVEKGQGGRGE